MACALHDVGKIGVPDAVLQKPGALNDVEFDTIRRHPEVGYRLLADSASDILHLAARVALTHHERWDGTGYPRRLVGTGIPLEGRIAAVADVFDAVTNRRVYRRAWEIDEAVAHLRDNRGRHFDPDLVDALLSGLDDALAVREQYPDDDPSAIVKVLVVDDHRMFAESVSRLLAAEPDVQVVATVGSAADAWAAVRAEAPDVVLMDWALPDGDGLETAKGIRGEHPEVNVVLLTGVGDGPLVAEALKAGCCGFLRKDQAFDKLARAVRAAAQGESIVPAAQIVAALGGLVPDRPGPVGLLTGRELAVLSFAARGLRNDVIADRLQLSLHSVRNHVRNASAKLDSHSKLEAVTTAVRQGLISLS
jgi:response regulator RpfG family c-di-GMP phosphodiesterase/DNA-binding CsgD family transcriptional regulator